MLVILSGSAGISTDIPPHPGEMALGAQPEQRLTPAARHWDERRVQLLTRAWSRADRSWADAACAHNSASATGAGLGGLTTILPNPSLGLKPRGINIGNPPGTRGTSSRHQLAGDNTVCGGQTGLGHPGSSRPLPGTTAHRHAGNELIPTSHRNVNAQPLFKDDCQL